MKKISTLSSLEQNIIEQSTRFAQQKMKNLHSSHGWDHVERVANIADHIASIESDADYFIVIVAAILHDIARPDEDASSGALCHATLGSEMAEDFLHTTGLDKEKINIIVSAIKCHRFRGNNIPQSIEAKILYDADKLDSIGAVGIGRAFLFSGEIGARLHNSVKDIASTNAYSEEDTAYREFIVKLRTVKDKMLTAEGKRLAQERHDFMELFFERFQREIQGIV